MPFYVYVKEEDQPGCARCRKEFEIERHMDDPPLERCPECGGKVRLVWTSVNVGKSNRNVLGDDNLKRHGFHKLVNEGDGKFRKTV